MLYEFQEFYFGLVLVWLLGQVPNNSRNMLGPVLECISQFSFITKESSLYPLIALQH